MKLRKTISSKLLRFGGGAGAILLLLVFAARTYAAIDLLYFHAQAGTDRIDLVWETATELDNSGYFILRNQSGGTDPGNYSPVPVVDAITGTTYNFIPARGDDLTGALYEFYDPNVTIGTRYFYFLQDVDSNNNSSFEGPREAVAGQTSTPAPSNTPTRTRTPVPSGSATATSTRTPFPLASATRTPSPTASPSQETPTVVPSATITPDPSLGPVDLTLTAISIVLTEMPTDTATITPVVLANRPTATRIQISDVDLTETAGQDTSSLPPGRIAGIVFFVLLGGGLLTAGFLFVMRRENDESGRGPR